MVVDDLTGKRVRAKVLAWDEAKREREAEFPDPAIPDYTGVPEYVEGTLFIHKVSMPSHGIDHTKYIVDSYDVEPASIEEIEDE